MKKKFSMRSFWALLLVAALTAAMPMTALGAQTEDNINGDGIEVTAPGNGINNPYGASEQEAGQSYNQATANSTNGTDWTVLNDDDNEAKASDTTTDINVWARITDASAKIYKIDIEWGAMKFEFNDGSGAWNTETHSYEGTVGGDPHWVNNIDDITEETGYEVGANGTNNKITVTNHSNSAINAEFLYAMVNASAQTGASGTAVTPFNDGGAGSPAYGAEYQTGFSGSYNTHGDHDVIGNFFGSNGDAAKPHKAIAGTYDGGSLANITGWFYDNGTQYTTLDNPPDNFLEVYAKENEAASVDDLANTIVLPTEDWSHKPSQTGESTNNPWTTVDTKSLGSLLTGFNSSGDADLPTYSNGARAANVYFAFSGQPDKGQGAFLPVFTKVGVITVTIEPNNASEYNTNIATP